MIVFHSCCTQLEKCDIAEYCSLFLIPFWLFTSDTNPNNLDLIYRKQQAWDESPTYQRRLSSTPDIKRQEPRQKRATNDTDMDEIDARLNALQQYMKEIERKN